MITDNKIGIGIVHCLSTPGSSDIGYTVVFKSDNGKWSSIIDDTGSVFKYVSVNYETILRMVHFAKDGHGWYMCSMKPIPGRAEEYRATWVYFPSALNLSQKDIKNIIETAECQIKGKEFDENALFELIGKFQKFNDKNPLYSVPLQQEGFAFRDTKGTYNLYDLYDCMYQKSFTKYEWVLLMDKQDVTFKGNGIQDISDEEIIESLIISPKPNKFGFIPYYNGEEFSTPIRIMRGDKISVEFRKNGYANIYKEVRSQDDLVIFKEDCMKAFRTSLFVARDAKTGNKIDSATITPSTRFEYDISKKLWFFAEQDLDEVQFEVKANGYASDSFVYNLCEKNQNEEIKFELEPETHKYTFELPIEQSVVKDVVSVQFSINSQFAIKESPIKGFKCSGYPSERVVNKLQKEQLSVEKIQPTHGVSKEKENLTTGKKNKNVPDQANQDNRNTPEETERHNTFVVYAKNIGFIIALLAIISVLGYFVYGEFFSNKKVVENGEQTFNSAEIVDNWNPAYTYLQQHTSQISKNEMESYDELKGLYDIINSYKFNDLVKYIDKHQHRNDILSIDEWKRLYDKAQKINSNKKGVFNNEESEQSITLENLLNKDFSNIADEDAANEDKAAKDKAAKDKAAKDKAAKDKAAKDKAAKDKAAKDKAAKDKAAKDKAAKDKAAKDKAAKDKAAKDKKTKQTTQI